MTAEPRRLHRLSWLFLTASSAKGLILPLIFVFFASASNPFARFELLGAVFLIPTLISALIRQRIYNYRFAEDELVVREGVLTKKERHIPYERIHNIAVIRNPFHRMFGVASALIETAGSGKPEAVLRVLDMPAIAELRHLTLGAEEDVDPADDVDTDGAPATVSREQTTLLEVPTAELAKLGLISNRGAIIFAALAAFLTQAQLWQADGFDPEDWASRFKVQTPDWVTWLLDSSAVVSRVLLGVGVILVFLALLRLVSIGWHLVKYHGFTLVRQRGDLRTEFGLLTTVSSIIPTHKIQLVTTHDSILHRLLRRTSIDLETVGASEQGSDFEKQLAQGGFKSRQLLAPILEAGRAAGFLRQVLPDLDLEAVEWQPLSTRARQRIMKRMAIITGIQTFTLMSVLSVFLHPLVALHALWLPAVVLPLVWFGATGWLRYSRWGLTDNAVYYRSGWLGRAVSVVPFDKVQTVVLSASPFDRRKHMASVAVDTAGAGAMGHRIDIPYLDRSVAETIYQRLYAEAGSTEFNW